LAGWQIFVFIQPIKPLEDRWDGKYGLKGCPTPFEHSQCTVSPLIAQKIASALWKLTKESRHKFIKKQAFLLINK
jgi:hypothetical protein